METVVKEVVSWISSLIDFCSKQSGSKTIDTIVGKGYSSLTSSSTVHIMERITKEGIRQVIEDGAKAVPEKNKKAYLNFFKIALAGHKKDKLMRDTLYTNSSGSCTWMNIMCCPVDNDEFNLLISSVQVDIDLAPDTFVYEDYEIARFSTKKTNFKRRLQNVPKDAHVAEDDLEKLFSFLEIVSFKALADKVGVQTPQIN